MCGGGGGGGGGFASMDREAQELWTFIEHLESFGKKKMLVYLASDVQATSDRPWQTMLPSTTG